MRTEPTQMDGFMLLLRELSCSGIRFSLLLLSTCAVLPRDAFCHVTAQWEDTRIQPLYFGLPVLQDCEPTKELNVYG